MTVAVTHALAAGAKAVICASTGNTSASAAAYAARAGLTSAVLIPQGKIAAGQAGPGRRLRRADPADRGQFRRLPGAGPQDRGRAPGDRAGQLGQPGPDRGPEDRGVRDLRRAGPRARRALPAGRQRGQHHRVLEGLQEYHADGVIDAHCRGCSASRPPARRRWCSATRCCTRTPSPPRSGSARPASWDGAIDARDASHGLIDCRHRRADPGRLPAARLHRGRVRRARVGRLGRRAARHRRRRPAAGRVAGGLHRHRQRAEGPGHRHDAS